MNKEITIKNLARMFQKSLSETAKKTNSENLEKKMDNGFQEVERKLKMVDTRLNQVNLLVSRRGASLVQLEFKLHRQLHILRNASTGKGYFQSPYRYH